jgi:hypothetical protein
MPEIKVMAIAGETLTLKPTGLSIKVNKAIDFFFRLACAKPQF